MTSMDEMFNIRIIIIGTAYENSQLSANRKYMSDGSENKSHETLYTYKDSCKILAACNVQFFRVNMSRKILYMTTVYEKF